jgi:hypothetical protein
LNPEICRQNNAKITSMKNFQPTLEHAVYALALAVAVGLRFLHLGALPLSDFEADWALQALRITQGLKPPIGPNPAYVHLTAVLFYIFGATNFLSRFWPALVGSALVPAAWSLRGRFGRIPALILAFGLAIDPGLVAMSHLAGGPMLAIAFLVLSALMWMDGHRAAAGLFAGLALLSGPSVWFGLAGVGLAWVFGSRVGKKIPAEAGEKTAPAETRSIPVRFRLKELRVELIWGIGTLLIAGSLFILSPKGLPAFVASLGIFLRGWWTLSNVQLWRLLLALPAYEILPLAFGFAGVVRGILKRDADTLQLGIWALVALLLALIYPGKQTGDLVWALLPLWILAAIELARHFDFQGSHRWEVAGTVTVVMAFLVFGWLNLASITNMNWDSELVRTRLWLLAAVVLLIALSLLLVGTGWSVSVARWGGVWGGTLALVLFTIAMSTGAAGLRQPLTVELWQPEPRTGRVDILLKVANQISDLNRGYAGQLPLTILNMDSLALHWLFRDWQVQDVSQLAPDASPELIITSSGNLSLSAKYRGEALVLSEKATWDKATSADWLKWFMYRQMPLMRDNVTLWVRSDLMLDSQDTAPAP